MIPRPLAEEAPGVAPRRSESPPRSRPLSRWLGAAVFLLACTPGSSHGLRATVGLEYDDNPFESRSEGRSGSESRSGWINRIFLSSSARIGQTPRYAIQVRHRWGLKRYWMAEQANGSQGDVVASQLELGGRAQVSERIAASWGSEVKIKNVQRISSEESYLRGSLQLGLSGRLDNGFIASLKYRRGADDARDTTLGDLSVAAWGGDVAFRSGRKFTVRLAGIWRRLDYDRAALGEGDPEAATGQSDTNRELKVVVQLYRGGLVDASYALLDNDSNSTGFGYRAHRFQLLCARHLGGGIDGQLFLALQRRRYDEELPAILLAGVKEDGYHQTLWSFKLSRQINEFYGVSGQYRRARNGSSRSEGAYEKRIYSLAVDVEL